MALRAQLTSHSMLHHLRGPAGISARSAVMLGSNFSTSLRCFSSNRLQLAKKSIRNDSNFPNAVSQTMFNPLSEAKLSSEGIFCVQKLRCSHLTAIGNSLQASVGRRFLYSSSTINSEAITRADGIDGTDDGCHIDRPEPKNGPGNSGMVVTGRGGLNNNNKGTTDGSSDPSRLSSLYVPRFARERYASVLTPHLNFDKAFADVESLANDLQKREGYGAFTVDKLNTLKDDWKRFTHLKSEVDETEEKEFQITKQRKLFVEKMKSAGSELKGEEKEVFDGLGADLLIIRKKLKSLTPQLNDLEQTVVPDLLQLPNTIDKTTPLLEDKVLFSLYDPPEFEFPAKSHTELGGLNQTLELSDVAPGAFYLLGDLAQAELALQDLLKDQLGTCFRYLQHANPDFGNGVTVEGCGFAIHDPSELLRLMAHSADGDSKEFLTGGSSLPSFAGYFAKKAVTKTKKFLPQKLFTIGRLYTPRKMLSSQETCTTGSMPQDSVTRSSPDREQLVAEKGQGILSSMQSTSVSAFVADTKESNSEENVVNELLAVSTAVYTKLGLHFRIVQRNATALKPFEKAAYSVEMTTTSFQKLQNASHDSQSSVNPNSETISTSESVRDGESHTHHSKNSGSSSPTYTEIGRISVIGNYVSKRLLMLYDKRDVLGGVSPNQRGGSSTRHGFLNVVFAEVINVSKFLAVMVENTQTKEGGYEIPALLHEYPVMTGPGGNGNKD